MRMTVAASLLALIGGAVPRAAQTQSGGTIAGTVVDASGRPVVDADVYALPEKARARTDSAGRFAISKLGAGFYHVRVRHLGFRPNEITTDLTNNGRVELKFELVSRPVMLDSVIVQADGKCPTMSYTGFLCRRRTGKGLYL